MKRFAAMVLAGLAAPALAQYGGTVDPNRPLSFQPFAQAEHLPGQPGGAPAGVAPAELGGWQRDLIGKRVEVEGGGEVGEVVDISVGPDQRVAAVVVALNQPTRRLIAVPWQWMATQLGGSRVVLPAEVVALSAGRAEGGRLAGWRTSWLDGAPARLQGGGAFGTVDGFVFDATGQVAQVVVREDAGGRLYAVPRDRLSVDPQARTVTLVLTRPELEALGPIDPGRTRPATAMPAREAEERRLGAELDQWRSRVDAAAHTLGETDPQVLALRQAYDTAEVSWSTLRRQQGPNWEVGLAQTSTAFDDLRRQWEQLAEAR